MPKNKQFANYFIALFALLNQAQKIKLKNKNRSHY